MSHSLGQDARRCGVGPESGCHLLPSQSCERERDRTTLSNAYSEWRNTSVADSRDRVDSLRLDGWALRPPWREAQVTAHAFRFFDSPFIAMAHRGGTLWPPNAGIENTEAAFGHALELGYRYLETDVHASADGHLVALHDDRLERVSDHSGRVADLTLDELADVRVGGREPIPTMSGLLSSFPEARFNIDVKHDAAVAPLARLIDEAEAHDRVCVGSFSDTRLRRFRDLTRGRVATSAGPTAVAYTVAAPLLPRWVNTPGQAFQVPVIHTVAGHPVRILTPRLIETAHRRGMVVHVWDVDEADEMRRLLALGVDGIITDAIDVLKDVLIGAGRWHV